MTYQLLNSNSVQLTENGTVYIIPFDPKNSDYQVYLQWMSEGHTPSPVPEVPLAVTQSTQVALLYAAYMTARDAAVTCTTKAGVTQTYQADPTSIANLQAMLAAFAAAPTALPPTFYWVAADNTQVPFVYADMQQLALNIGAQGAAAFAHYQTQKALVNAATTNDAVLAIVW